MRGEAPCDYQLYQGRDVCERIRELNEKMFDFAVSKVLQELNEPREVWESTINWLRQQLLPIGESYLHSAGDTKEVLLSILCFYHERIRKSILHAISLLV